MVPLLFARVQSQMADAPVGSAFWRQTHIAKIHLAVALVSVLSASWSNRKLWSLGADTIPSMCGVVLLADPRVLGLAMEIRHMEVRAGFLNAYFSFFFWFVSVFFTA